MAVRASTEEKLLDAAEALLFTRGIAATPVDEILARAGVSTATLYRAYPSKEALVAAALGRRHRGWLATWEAAVERAPDDRGRLLAVFDALDDFRGRPEGARWCAFLATAAEYVDPPDEVAAAVRLDTDSLRSRLRALASLVVGGEGRARDRAADDLAERLLLVVSGDLAMRLRASVPSAVADARVARSVAETLVDRAVAGSTGSG